MEQPTEPGFYWARVNDRNGELRWMTVELSRWGLEMGKIMLQPHHVLVPGESGPRCPSTVAEWGPRIEPPGSWDKDRYPSWTHRLVRCSKCGEVADETTRRGKHSASR